MSARKIDGYLDVILSEIQDQSLDDTDAESFGIDASAAQPEIAVLVHHTGSTEEIETAGLRVVSRFGDVVSGRVAASAVQTLAELDSVIHIEGPHPMSPDLDVSVPDINANMAHSPGVGTPPQSYRGTGVIVGIIDSGIDFTHAAFRNADGTSRILAIWDQGLTVQGTESSPAPFGYGVEYSKADIDSALTNAAPFSVVRHQDDNPFAGGHGTHVSGTAAGNGRTANTFVGVAPGADIIVVSPRRVSEFLGDSVRHAEAVRYIFAAAEAAGHPAVINMSLGDNIGAHDGTAILERAIDFELGNPGCCMCKSAGNAANDAIASTGTVAANANTSERLTFAAGSRRGIVDLWYSRQARLNIVITDPGGNSTTVLAPPATNAAPANHTQVLGGCTVRIDSSIDNRFNHDNRILIRITRPNPPGVTAGNWSIVLTETSGNAAVYHAWIQRGRGHPTFPNSPDSTRSTISIPGTSREVITVGGYRTKDSSGSAVSAGSRDISGFSSRGPTRDGRIKPDIAAPGEYVMAPLSSSLPPAAAPPASDVDSSGTYQLMRGTSMATPHVTGAVALILEKTPTLRQAQVLDLLKRTARTDSKTGTGNNIPNNTWGYGKLDVNAALQSPPAAMQSRNWVRIRPQFANWTMHGTPPRFEISANENGTAVIELAWDPQALLAPSSDYPERIRYYSTDEALDVTITKADGTDLRIQTPAQVIQLTGNQFDWTMPQALWDGFLEECGKSLATPVASTFNRNIYYRVRFTATGASSALVWPPDAAIQGNPHAPHMGIIALSSTPSTQVALDGGAIAAMGSLGTFVTTLWENLPEADPHRQALARILGNTFFTNHMEAEIRGKVLKLWLFAGPDSRPRLPDLLDTRFRTPAGLEMTVLKQPDLKDGHILLDHLLNLVTITQHPDMLGVTVPEQLVDDVITEIMDPNGQVNQGRASTCAPTGVQTLFINSNASEYARLQCGLLSSDARAILANGEDISIPPGIFQMTRYGGAQNSPFYVRTYSELAFQAGLLKFAKGNRFPSYDPNAAPDDPDGINSVFQATIGRGLTRSEMERGLEGLFGRPFQTEANANPSENLRNQFLQALTDSSDPLMLVMHWRKPHTDPTTRLHAVVAMRREGGRVFFKNPQYSGSRPPSSAQANATTSDPPRRYDDPSQTLESIGDDDLSSWIRWYHV